MRKKTQRAMRFERDLDSDWTVKNKIPMFGMKEHAAVDVESGLVLSTHVSKASEHDTNYFRYVVMKGIHGKQCPTVYADKGYCGKANREFLCMNGIDDGIMRKSQINASLTEMEIERNKVISRVRYKRSPLQNPPRLAAGMNACLPQGVIRGSGASPLSS
jgi:IS5 family transposase